jgi:hypothetical protein
MKENCHLPNDVDIDKLLNYVEALHVLKQLGYDQEYSPKTEVKLGGDGSKAHSDAVARLCQKDIQKAADDTQEKPKYQMLAIYLPSAKFTPRFFFSLGSQHSDGQAKRKPSFDMPNGYQMNESKRCVCMFVDILPQTGTLTYNLQDMQKAAKTLGLINGRVGRLTNQTFFLRYS